MSEDYQDIHDKYKGSVVIGEQKTSEAIDKLWPAYIEAQKNFGDIHKDAEAKVTYKNDASKSFKFRYATLPNIMEAIRKPLLDQGLWVSQSMSEIKNGGAFITTVLRHVSGQFMAARRPIAIPNANDQKELGIAETYGRRYSLTSFLGIAADEDTDAINSFPNADRVSHRQANNPLSQPHKPAQTTAAATPKEAADTIGWELIKEELALAGVPEGDSALAKDVILYVTSGKVTLAKAFHDSSACGEALEAICNANVNCPADKPGSLLSIVKAKKVNA